MRAFKFVNLVSAEWAVKTEVGEAPMFGSPAIDNKTKCPLVTCDVMYSPIAYQVGRVEAQHFHPFHSLVVEVNHAGEERVLVREQRQVPEPEPSWLMGLSIRPKSHWSKL